MDLLFGLTAGGCVGESLKPILVVLKKWGETRVMKLIENRELRGFLFRSARCEEFYGINFEEAIKLWGLN